MKNLKIAQIFDETADILEMQDVQFKPRAYQKAAVSIRSLSEDVEEIYNRGGLKALERIPGVGASMAQKIEEFIKTGRMKYYDQLKKKMPAHVGEMVAIEGVGPKLVEKAYKELGIKTLSQLEKAAKAGKLRKIKGLGPKVEENILEGIALIRKRKGRFLLGFLLPEAEDIRGRLASLPYVEKVDLAGSIRRGKETIGDIDILAISKNPKKVIDFFISLPPVERIVAKGPTKGAVRLKAKIDCDLRVLKRQSYGAALMYFTGSKAHNIKMRKIAMEHGWKLSEYGLFSDQKKVAGKSEEEVYKKLKMPFIPPELREDNGEIEAALDNRLPKLIEKEDIKGALHVHSEWSSDAMGSIEEIARTCERMGLEYVLITDHTGTLRIAGGLSERELLKELAEIRKIDKKFKNIKILCGAETNIEKDGSIDIGNKVLRKLDIVIAGVHSNFRMSKGQMTKRMIRAIENRNVDIIAHPTGRLIQRREPYELDLDKVFVAAKKNNTALELNAFPDRLDLSAENVRRAIKFGVKIAIGLDSHSISQLRYLELGVITARRSWAEKKNIINTLSAERLVRMFK
jgi:DNA polymerase (family 10)